MRLRYSEQMATLAELCKGEPCEIDYQVDRAIQPPHSPALPLRQRQPDASVAVARGGIELSPGPVTPEQTQPRRRMMRSFRVKQQS